ncbi:MAG: hypothetical protein CM15mV11_0970 [Caudoviricetes sp.]|nr:MAG: hypothetical protein CM15mV11_0970 [Caudoviricetes sp.]
MHVILVDIDGGVTGTVGALLERYIDVSKASDAKTSVGETNYYAEVIKQKSEFIYWAEHEATFCCYSSASDGLFGQTAANRQFNLFRSANGSTDYPAGVQH